MARAPTRPGRPSAVDKKRLVHDSLPYVRAIAARIKDSLPREIEFDDLVAYGTQGLLEAADRYDGRHGASFTTFAYYRVRGAIFDGLRGMGWLPRGEYARARFEERAAAYLQNLADREMGAESLGHRERSLEDEVRDLAMALGGVAAVFVTSLNLDDEHAMRDNAPHPQERIEQREVERTLRAALFRLPDKERRLIEMYYFEDKTLEDAGALLGLSKSWASRLHARAIELLKVGLGHTPVAPTPSTHAPPPPPAQRPAPPARPSPPTARPSPPSRPSVPALSAAGSDAARKKRRPPPTSRR